ncbi:MAG: WYL domain-containing protein [Mycobacteriales bacterium]|nr:WYL domain-containing protein [Mycobacteriales bacterium]
MERSLTSLPFVPSVEPPPLLANNAKATEQFARLMDALLILDAERSCRVSELAARVGLEPGRMRELLSAYMVAGAEALGPDAPFNLTFGTADGSLSGDEDDDAAQGTADVVHLSGMRERGQSLLGDLGRRPVMVKDVARVLLAGTLLLRGDDLPAERRLVVQALVDKLSAAMGASVDAPAEASAEQLQRAVLDRCRVRFRYLHPWTGESSVVEVEPYDVHRRRDRLVLDAGASAEAPLVSYDVGGISELVVLAGEAVFAARALPPRGERVPRVPVVLRVTTEAQEDWVCKGWKGVVVGPSGDGRLDIAIQLDGSADDPAAAERLGAFLLQLGPGASVVSPEGLRDCARPVALRLLAQLTD